MSHKILKTLKNLASLLNYMLLLVITFYLTALFLKNEGTTVFKLSIRQEGLAISFFHLHFKLTVHFLYVWLWNCVCIYETNQFQ